MAFLNLGRFHLTVRKIHNFHASLKIGQAGELKFLAANPGKLEHLDGKIADFKILKNGKTIELKMDSYDPKATSNFFFEMFSYDTRPGGAYQALSKGVDYFIYCFRQSMECFVFDTQTLVNELKRLYPNPKLINIRNVGHITQGFKVGRSELEHIRLKLEDIL